MTVTLLHGGVITTAIAPEQKAPDALVVADGKIAWIGDSSAENALPPLAEEAERIDLNGALVTPAFHDAKLDLFALGHHLTGDSNDQDALRAGLAACARAGFAVLNHHQTTPSAEQVRLLTEVVGNGREFPRVEVYAGGRMMNAQMGQKLLEALPALRGFAALAVDGDFADHGAALDERYFDLPAPQWSGADPGRGELVVSAEELAAHLVVATELGVAATVRARGDRALHAVATAFERAAEQVGAEALRGAGHQLECADLIDATTLTTLVLFDVAIIAYPRTSLASGGADGLYARRLGPVQAQALHPWADLITTGVELRFATEAPGGPLDPWSAVLAATNHPDPGQRMAMIDAFGAHTGGNIALLPGQAADFAVWTGGPTAQYPLRARRGYGQLETVLTLPALEALTPGGLDDPLVCERVFRAGTPLRQRHAEE